MSKRAWLYIIGVIAAGAVLGGATLLSGTPSSRDWEALGVLTTLATGVQLFKSLFKSKSHSDSATTSYSPILVFLFAGVLLLPPFLYVLLVLIPHLIDWLKERYLKTNNLPRWYIQPFNIAAHIICGIVAQQSHVLFGLFGTVDPLPTQLTAGILAVLVYAGLNHLMVGLALVIARGATWRESGVLEVENLLPDLIMMILGFGMALLWELNPWFILTALSPLVLIQRALMVTQLKQEARVDSKTGLWNARHFAELFKAEFARAVRFDRPLAVIMSDLDLLRNINNTYGHLAGDNVLTGIGDIIRRTVREYDIAARFGGEEFVIVLPETKPADAIALAERLRKAVESAEFHSRNATAAIRATLSLGIACLSDDGATMTDLIHAADVAVYQAKLQGRNRVVSIRDLPHSVDLETAGAEDRLSNIHMSEFMPRPSELRPIGADRSLPAVQTASVGTAGEHTTPRQAVTERGGEAGRFEESPATQGPPTAEPAGRGSDPDAQQDTEKRHNTLFDVIVGVVIACGACLAVGAFVLSPQPDLALLALFALLAAGGELLQVQAFENTISVSAAVNFAAGLVAGVPGLVFASGAIALVHRWTQPEQFGAALYKTAYNWSTHMLAGLAPVLVIGLLRLPLDISHLLIWLIPVTLASVAYYGIETGLFAIAMGTAQRENPWEHWKRNFRWVTSHYLVLCMMGFLIAVAYNSLGIVGIIVFSLPAVMMRYALGQYVDRTRASVQELKRMNEELTHSNTQVIRAGLSIRHLNDELFLTLAKIIDARDPYVSGHAGKVADYAKLIAIELGLSPERIEQVRQSALLHDIGKIGISEQVLHKAAHLDPKEYEYVKTHSALGDEFLKTSRGLRHLAPFVRHHHERWDGMGYPDGLRGEAIPLESRIISVCDAVEAMASDRPYSRAMSVAQIVAEMRRCSGTQFDPRVAEALVHIAETEGTHLIVNSARQVAQSIENGALPQWKPAWHVGL